MTLQEVDISLLHTMSLEMRREGSKISADSVVADALDRILARLELLEKEHEAISKAICPQCGGAGGVSITVTARAICRNCNGSGCNSCYDGAIPYPEEECEQCGNCMTTGFDSKSLAGVLAAHAETKRGEEK